MTGSFDRQRAVTGCLLGTAVGDALGLPMEGLSRTRQSRLFPDPVAYHFVFGRGMVSDDTQHQVMTAQALLQSAGDPERFARDMAGRMRKWLAALPAGVGFATLRAILKSSAGFSPHRSGVFSAGNGPAMRSALIGIGYGHDPERLHQLVRCNTRLTHTDPQAEYGALAVAWAAHHAARQQAEATSYRKTLQQHVRADSRFFDLIELLFESIQRGEDTPAFAESMELGKGVGGYMYHILPVVLHAWLRHPTRFLDGLLSVIRCGGDTDTTGAILGSIVGAGVGREGIPEPWLTDLNEWPQTVEWMEGLGESLADFFETGQAHSPPETGYLPMLLRNLFFLGVVLAHGFRRTLPPY
ncbi:ADP-ribosylglycohydrolase family protein [Nitrospina sp. 32_T5]|uniref:ADP-ribosylglycohydrolase family protein n=1 Tax=unclassified Nitrospina TaxID=2638683 RepID=UPI003F980510